MIKKKTKNDQNHRPKGLKQQWKSKLRRKEEEIEKMKIYWNKVTVKKQLIPPQQVPEVKVMLKYSWQKYQVAEENKGRHFYVPLFFTVCWNKLCYLIS